MWHPEIAKQVAAAGMTIGSHTWSHKDLAKNPYASNLDQAKAEIEMGVSAVHMRRRRTYRAILPLSRTSSTRPAAELSRRAKHRHVFDRHRFFRLQDAPSGAGDPIGDDQAAKARQRHRLLMHDFRPATAAAMPELLRQLKAGGYKVVHMVPKQPMATLTKYDDMVSAAGQTVSHQHPT